MAGLRWSLIPWLLLLSLSACITEERIPGNPAVRVRHVNEDSEPVDRREETLLEAVEENPADPKAWWQLGNLYEGRRNFMMALGAYQRMQEEIAKNEREGGRRYTAGPYLTGKMNALLRRWPEAIRSLKAVLALEPTALERASMNVHYREAHFLLAAIYLEHSQWPLAKKHLLAFEALGGGAHRSAGMRIQIEDAVEGYSPR